MHGCVVTLICIVHGRRLADQQRKKKLAAQTKADIKRQKAIEAKAVEAEKEAPLKISAPLFSPPPHLQLL